MKKTLLFTVLCISSFFGKAQEDTVSVEMTSTQLKDSIVLLKTPTRVQVRNNTTPFFKNAWVPIGLSVVSIDLLRGSTKYGLQEMARSFVKDDFRTRVDDYIHYAPVVMMYGADLFGIEARNTVWNQTKYLAISEIFTSALVLSLKYGLRIQRPNNGSYNAYPSGHTAQSFVQSQAFYNEFRDTHPLFAASGYLFSISTGALRILNNRHWVPDVLLGAGIGILVTNAVYHFEPLKNWNPFDGKRKSRKSTMQMSFMPSVNMNYTGARLKFRF